MSHNKVFQFYFHDNFGKFGPIFRKIIFTFKFKKDLWRKVELKLPLPLKSVTTLPCKKESGQLYSFAVKLFS